MDSIHARNAGAIALLFCACGSPTPAPVGDTSSTGADAGSSGDDAGSSGVASSTTSTTGDERGSSDGSGEDDGSSTGDTPPCEGTRCHEPVECDANRFVTSTARGGGDGSVDAPWTLAEAMTNASAGDRVQVAPGTYVGAATGDRYLPSFAPANSGTADAPIVFCAQYPAVYHEDDPASWSVIQNDGPSAGDEACSPAFGVAHQSYVVWDGFAVDQADAPWRPDTSPITIVSAAYVTVMRNRVVARDRPFYDNNNGIRMDDSHHVAITDNRILCPDDDGEPSNDPGGIQSYDSSHYEWAHNEIEGCDTGFHPKGVHEWSERYLLPGSIHHNLLVGVSHGVYAQAVPGVAEADVQPDEWLDVHQNVFVDGEYGVTLNPVGDGQCRRMRFVNNTLVGFAPIGGVALQLVSVPGPTSFGLSMWRNNIVAAGPGAYGFQGGDEAERLAGLERIDFDYNRFFDVQAIVAVTDHVVPAPVISSLAEWQARGNDEHASVGDPGFVDYAGRDLRLAADSACRDAGIDVLDLQGLGPDAPIHLGAYISDEQTDAIGIR